VTKEQNVSTLILGVEAIKLYYLYRCSDGRKSKSVCQGTTTASNTLLISLHRFFPYHTAPTGHRDAD
jgi:hypothetical protein